MTNQNTSTEPQQRLEELAARNTELTALVSSTESLLAFLRAEIAATTSEAEAIQAAEAAAKAARVEAEAVARREEYLVALEHKRTVALRMAEERRAKIKADRERGMQEGR